MTTAAAPTVDEVGRDAWRALVAGFADHNYRQTFEFGEVAAARVGARSVHVAIRSGGDVIAVADVRVKSVPLLGGLAYVNGGPLVRRGRDVDPRTFVAAVAALRDEFGRRRGLVVRVVPPIGPAAWNASVAAGLAEAGFAATDAARSYRTMLVDIDRPAAALRKAFRQKWRNGLNRSERSGLTVRHADTVEALREFAGLFGEFIARKGFNVDLGIDFYERVQAVAPAGERYAVLLAELEGRPVAGHVSSPLGDTSVYLLGATTPDALKCNAAYLLQWRAIELAQARGCRWYDLGGIDPVGNPGVFHFKEGMSGDDVTSAAHQWAGGLRPRAAAALEARWKAWKASRSAGGAVAAVAAEPAPSEPATASAASTATSTAASAASSAQSPAQSDPAAADGEPPTR